ncbi:MAG: hypothetical protein JWR27_26 [Aeromicrobium sp.]|jgi:hypothetical protein|nr:hypothetical protein [Aeromicrobium sp.]
MPSPQSFRGRGARLPRSWPQLWALVLIAPAALAVTSMSGTMAAAAIGLVFGLSTVTALAMTADTMGALRVQLRVAVRFGACSLVTCLGFCGLFVLSPPLALASIATYVVTAAWSACSSGAPTVRAAAARPEPEEPTAGLYSATSREVRSMTDVELCRVWRRSLTLMSTCTLGRRASVVSLRQVLLDEMETRHPAGLQAWLDSGAGAANGPEEFLGRSDEGGTTQAA